MIGVGAALGHYTTEGGYLYPDVRTVQIDANPRGLWQGLRTADLRVRADARAAAEAIVAPPAAARRLEDRLPHQRDGQADRGRLAGRQGIPGAAQHGRSAQDRAGARPGGAEGLGGRGRRRPLFQHSDDAHEGPAGRALLRGQRFRRHRLGAASKARYITGLD